ncbi:4'-phosphopantetheinyl transferase superfamily protein [Marinimicrobium agarilyticum]|uniref:4'-phosphopantetheinyl transferase family protein n=1 Tax=Marinimicrobium agarilyticum TaxID=306546 RepID=UPI000684D31F
MEPVIFQCRYELADFRDDDFATLHVHRPQRLTQACRKRRAEYLAGRYAAKRVLEHLGYPWMQVGSDEDRVPVWPRRLKGSISHTNHEAVCAAFEGGSAGASVGVDVERYLCSSKLDSVRELVVTRSERGLIANNAIDESWALTLFFSAKESLFKALYPQTRAAFDFREAEITVLNQSTKTFTIRLRTSVHVRFPKGWTALGRYFDDAGHLTTLVVL